MITYNHVYARTPGTGWLDAEEGQNLFTFALLTEGPILEVGSYHGKSAVLLAHLERPVICVDPFNNFDSDYPDGNHVHEKFLENTKDYPNITIHRMKIEDWTPQPVGFAYLDGDHTYEGTVRQIEIAMKCNPKYIAMHDVSDGGQGLEIKRAALERFGDWILRAGKMAVFDAKVYKAQPLYEAKDSPLSR